MTRLTKKTSLEWKSDPSGSFNSYRVADVNFDTNQALNISDNNYVGAYQSDKDRVGGKFTQLSWTSELRGFDASTGGRVPEGALLQSAGFAAVESGSPTTDLWTFTLGDPHNATDGGDFVAPASIGHTVDGFKTWSDSPASDIVFNFPATQIPTMAITARGLYRAVGAADTAAAFLVGQNPVAVGGYGLSVTPSGSSAITGLRCSSIQLALGNVINERPTVGGSGGFGFASPRIVSRDPIYTAVIEMDKTTLTNFENLYNLRTLLTWAFTHNTSGSAGDVIDVDFDCHIKTMPTYMEDNGIYMVTLVMQQSIDSGATPLTIAFS